MANADLCPTPDDLERFLLGRLAEVDAQRVEEHLAVCTKCLEAAQGLEAKDTLLCAMRAQGKAGARSEDAVVEKLVAQLGDLQPSVERDTDATVESSLRERPGAQIGPYKLLQIIGEGGMGVVWMAEQTQPVQRRVALKIIRPGLDSRQIVARFEAERQALALMDHPNIAKVFDGGTVGMKDEGGRMKDEKDSESSFIPHPSSFREAGRPYFVMELVKGRPITAYCDEHRLTPRQRLELFLPVCQAIQHAHQKGIIHRDIKPSNVLVAPFDGKPVPKVIDFGVAKATGQRLTEMTLFTEFGAVVGTLEYMSPEQAELNNQDIDTRSDIYSLGVLLYELLAGSPPFTKKELETAGLLEMLRVIREQEPSKPSTKLSSSDALPSLSANRGIEPAKLTRLLRGELDWIVMKALEKDRTRRYETANGFAMDLQRYLADEPVLACPPSTTYRMRKFVRRNKGPALAVMLVSLALVGGIIGTTVGMIRATQAEGHALAESGKKDKALTQVRDEQTRTKAALLRVRREAAHMAFEQAHAICVSDGPDHGVLHLAQSLGKAIEAELPDLEHSIRTQLASWARPLHPQRSIFYHPDEVNKLAVSLDGKVFATASQGPFARLWDMETLRQVGAPMRHGTTINSVAFSPDSKMLLTGSSDATAQLWEVATGKPLRGPIRHPDSVNAVAFNPDGKSILTGCSDKMARLWDVETGKALGLPFAHELGVTAVAFSPDGKIVLTGCGGNSNFSSACLWEVATRKPIGQPWKHTLFVQFAAFSSNGKTVATGNVNEARLQDVESGSSIKLPLGARAMAFSPDGKSVVGCRGTVHRWSVATGQPLGLPLEHRERRDAAAAVAFTPDGKFLLTAGNNFIYRWREADPHPVGMVMSPQAPATTGFVAFGRNDTSALAGQSGGKILIWDLRSGKDLVPHFKHTTKLNTPGPRVAISPDCKMAVTTNGLEVQLWDAKTGMPTGPSLRHEGAWAAVFSPDGKILLTGGAAGAQLWDVMAGTPLGSHLDGTCWAVAFSPDGKTVATGGDSSARLWETATRKTFGPPLEHLDSVVAVAFSPDGKIVATGSADFTVRLWEAATGKPLGLPLKHTSRPFAVTFSPDGKLVLAACIHGTHLWEVGTGKAVGPPLRFETQVVGAAFSSDGKTVRIGSQDGSVTSWPVAPVQGDVERITLWSHVLTGMQLDSSVSRELDVETRQASGKELDRLGGPPWP